MALLKILNANIPEENEALRKVSRPVGEITPRIRTLLEDMYETMNNALGVGLAAPQVGVLRRVVVIQIPEGEKLFLINPEIVSTEGEQCGTEGCLSVPGDVGIVRRPMNVTVRAKNEQGEEITVTGEGLLARALCHEIDHLDGIVYTDVADRMLDPEELEEMENPPEEEEEPPRRRAVKRRKKKPSGGEQP